MLLLSGLPLGAAVTPDPVPTDANPTFTFSQFQAGDPIRFVAYGDTRFTNPAVTRGTDPHVRKWLAERVAQEHPAVLLLTGDTPFTGASAVDWKDFQDETESWRTNSILVLPTIGNHEIYGGSKLGLANYFENFPTITGHRYYSALLGTVEVISLDCTSGTGKASPQADWFSRQLGHIPKQVQFLFILYHVPWVADRQSQVFANLPDKDALNLRAILEDHLTKIRARVIVFNGHIHNYERFERNGVEYVVTGGGGAEPYPLLFRGRGDLYRDTGFPVYHYLTLEVRNRELHAVMWKVVNPEAANLSVEAKDKFTLAAPLRRTSPRALPRTKTQPPPD
ncbi:MAG: metallophosphoesterase [Terracidiphilus sp.]